MTIITDQLFYLLCIPAVLALGLGKGGFAGVGMISTPLLALTMPPLQAAAILLPILLIQDAISVWFYRREWSAWNLKVLLPGSVVGVGLAWLFAAYVANAYVEIAVGVTGVAFALYTWFGKVPREPRRPSVPVGTIWGLLACFTSTIIQVRAPPYQVHILPQQLDKLTCPISRSATFRRAHWRPRPCCFPSRSPPTFSASGSRAARRPSCSTRSPIS